MLNRDNFVTITQPTGRVRWRRVNDRAGHVPGLVLEAHHTVQHFDHGVIHKQTEEWREVEIAD